jgi:hypothetical protein
MAPSVSGRAGYVYLLSNPSMPGLVKIGRTTRDPSRRAHELTSATGVPTPFRLEGYVRTDDAVRTEAEIHRRMGAERVNRRREFFRAEPSTALGVAKAVASSERSIFRKGGPKAARPALSGILFMALYANVIFWIAGLDYGIAWQPAAANAALALLMPSRFWRTAAGMFSRHGITTHFVIVCALSTVYAFTHDIDSRAIYRTAVSILGHL